MVAKAAHVHMHVHLNHCIFESAVEQYTFVDGRHKEFSLLPSIPSSHPHTYFLCTHICPQKLIMNAGEIAQV